MERLDLPGELTPGVAHMELTGQSRFFMAQHRGVLSYSTEAVEIAVKYKGYIDRQLRQVAEMKKLEERPLPADLDYSAIGGLRLEARQKLDQIRPMNLGQASRVSGVSPADLAALMIYLEK